MSTKASAKSFDLEGMSRDEAIIHLVNSGLELPEAKKYWKENRPEPKPSFKKAFYAELAEGAMTEARFEELIALEGGNVERHKSAHRMVFEMANAIWTTE